LSDCALPERASVYWRPTVSSRSLRRSGRWWTITTASHSLPFMLAGLLLVALDPVTAPLALVLLVHAWLIPELYAARGANVLRHRGPDAGEAERRALGLLGDLLDHGARELHAGTGLVLEPGSLGWWLLGDSGALLVAPGARRVFCYCVRTTGDPLPAGDRIAHLLLALRTDERGFATVANLSFSGAPWRVRRRMEKATRPALAEALARAGAAGVCPR
jgi:hypothetical protein